MSVMQLAFNVNKTKMYCCTDLQALCYYKSDVWQTSFLVSLLENSCLSDATNKSWHVVNMYHKHIHKQKPGADCHAAICWNHKQQPGADCLATICWNVSQTNCRSQANRRHFNMSRQLSHVTNLVQHHCCHSHHLHAHHQHHHRLSHQLLHRRDLQQQQHQRAPAGPHHHQL